MYINPKTKKPKRERFSFTLDPITHIRLKQKAAELRKPASGVAEMAILKYLKETA